MRQRRIELEELQAAQASNQDAESDVTMANEQTEWDPLAMYSEE